MREAFGEEGLEKLLAIRMHQQVAAYQTRLEHSHTLEKKVQTLAEVRSEEGYMAAVFGQEGEWLLVENHCPICDAATMRATVQS
jgi:predicted ArsR family transcriptional regulator